MLFDDVKLFWATLGVIESNGNIYGSCNDCDISWQK